MANTSTAYTKIGTHKARMSSIEAISESTSFTYECMLLMNL